jgi:glycosyltransferase involved in cell wall biosynthesis
VTGRLVLVVPADVAKPTGGNRYDRSLAAAMRRLGTKVEQRLAPGRWPVATATDRDRLAELLDGPYPVLVDGLLACGAPGAVARAVAGGCRVHVLVHMPLALEPRPGRTAADLQALEREALLAATGVVATSRWTAADLRHRYGLDGVAVAPPGADPAPVSAGSTPPRLLQLAAVTPIKDQLTVVDALARVQDLPWTADLTGPLDVDPGYTARVEAALDRCRLVDRVRLTGPVDGAGLQQAWDAADLLLLPSRAETWGMAVTEGLARGVPAVVSRGTGAEEALGCAQDGSVPGAAVPVGDPDALAVAIRDLLGPGREGARLAARARRQTLRSWQHTARDVLAAMS